MHDCPTCKVPLHDHEEVCPSCGTKQHVRRGSKLLQGQPGYQKPKVNMVPFVVTAIVVGVIGIFAAQTSWIGQLQRRGPVQEDPLEKMTVGDARNLIETKITEGLTAVGATGKFNYKSAGQPATKATTGPLELEIETALTDKNQRHAIIDPIKDYMEKAQIPTLVMNDTKAHATWTYTVSAPPPQSAPAAE